MFLVTVKSAGLKGHLKSCLFHTTCHIQGNQKQDGDKLLQGRLLSSVFSSRYFITECIIRLKANRRTLRVHVDTHTATYIYIWCVYIYMVYIYIWCIYIYITFMYLFNISTYTHTQIPFFHFAHK
jgi:hypothetical protein